jgi:hypothetical protein
MSQRNEDGMTKVVESQREAVARAICKACEENPDHPGDARGNPFRWQDYLGAADAAIAMMHHAVPDEEARVDAPGAPMKPAPKSRPKLELVPCPKCGAQPEVQRLGANWRFRCNLGHSLRQVTGHTMSTKGEAAREWNREHGTEHGLTQEDVAILAWELARVEFHGYTAAQMARQDLAAGNITSALARLRVESDKFRGYETPINAILAKPQQA